MMDVETKAPNKRKNSGSELSGKKSKIDKSQKKTPLVKQLNGGSKSSPVTNKKSPKQGNLQNSNKKLDKQKKVKPFGGTSEVQKIKKEKPNENNKEQGKKRRRGHFTGLKDKVKAGDKSVMTDIEEKIKALEAQDKLSKTGNRKLKLLRRLKKTAEENPPVTQIKKEKQTKQNSIQLNQGKKQSSLQQKQATAVKTEKGIIKKAKLGLKKSAEDEDQEDSDDEVEEEESDEDEEEDDDDDLEDEEISDEEEEESSKETSMNESTLNETDTSAAQKHERRYIAFVGNIPYDTTKLDLYQHFESCGQIKHVRIPLEKISNKPRGFAFIEFKNEESYQRCLSKHHSVLKERRINVLYTMGGKKKTEDQKKEIKAKNFKLQALRKQGILLGSKKENQKRSFRRKKQAEPETQE